MKFGKPKMGEWKQFGRDGVIRTHDPLHPMQVRYQAALRPDNAALKLKPQRGRIINQNAEFPRPIRLNY